ncbi:hypothetical protein, partial [Oenococcus oeni]|uniref:hypothetical protein n=1 Tax=Oenococcus oeni TaxID=1247 RepID=UPI00214A8D5E
KTTIYRRWPNKSLLVVSAFSKFVPRPKMHIPNSGNLLTWYILQQAETDQVIFPLTIHLFGYIASTFLMILFTVIVMFITHQRLKNIDMVSALKSNE